MNKFNMEIILIVRFLNLIHMWPLQLRMRYQIHVVFLFRQNTSKTPTRKEHSESSSQTTSPNYENTTKIAEPYQYMDIGGEKEASNLEG